MRVKQSIEHYNSKVKNNDQKMNIRKLAEIILPDIKVELAEQQIWHWGKGRRYHQVTVTMVKHICSTLKVDANFLFQNVNPKEDKYKELDVSGMISIMKVSGMKPNQVLHINKMKNL